MDKRDADLECLFSVRFGLSETVSCEVGHTGHKGKCFTKSRPSVNVAITTEADDWGAVFLPLPAHLHPQGGTQHSSFS